MRDLRHFLLYSGKCPLKSCSRVVRHIYFKLLVKLMAMETTSKNCLKQLIKYH